MFVAARSARLKPCPRKSIYETSSTANWNYAPFTLHRAVMPVTYRGEFPTVGATRRLFRARVKS